MSQTSYGQLVRVVRRLSRATIFTYRNVALTLMIAGWLGELAIMVGRNIVKVEPGWTVELVTLALVYGSLMYVGLTQRHIGFTLLTRKLAAHQFLSRVSPFVCIVITAILLYESIRSVVVAYQDGGTAIETPGFNYPNWLVVVVTPIMFFALLVHLVYGLIHASDEAKVPETN